MAWPAYTFDSVLEVVRTLGTAQALNDEPDRQLDYQLCTVPGSRLKFRGPLPNFAKPFVAVLGGNETFGKYVADPFPDLLSGCCGLPVANLGIPQAGLTLFSEERLLLDLASDAEVTVLQVLGAQNMSNRLYSVHARRNDRFLGASPPLREMFPDVDFAEINFTGHLISTLKETSEAAFGVLVEELKCAWVQRMRRILSLIESKVVLVWITDQGNRTTSEEHEKREPHFITCAMIDDLEDAIDGLVKVPVNGASSDKVFPAQEREAALTLPGQQDHSSIAEALAPIVTDLARAPGPRVPRAGRIDQSSFSISSGTAVNKSATRP